jgi:membrane dipeptidase
MKKYTLYLTLIVVALLFLAGAERDYLKLHRDALVVDLHSDTLMRMLGGFDFSRQDTTGQMDLPRLKEGGVDLQVFACFIATNTPKAECRPFIDKMIDTLEAQVGRHPDQIAICKTAAEAEKIIGDGKIAAFIGIENGVAIADTLENVKHFYDRGVRYMTLTHTASSDWCISSADTAPAFHGLTDFGRAVVKKMNELGMIVDISHASPAAVEEVLKITKYPVIASHSCVYALCPHDRNLTDDQIRAIAKNGGMIGINFFTVYLSKRWNEVSDSMYKARGREIDSIRTLYKDNDDKRHEAMKPFNDDRQKALAGAKVDVGTVVDHIDYIVKLVGPDYVGFGSDFDGVPWLPDGLKDCSMVPNITKELVRRGYSDKDIKKILGGNFMRIFHQVCDR